MMKKITRIAALLAATAFLLAGFPACSDEDDDEPTLEKIEISIDENTVKTEYLVNEQFNKSGITVMATYSDGDKKDVTDKAVFKATTADGEFTTATVGTYEVTLTASYDGKDAEPVTCTITVKEKIGTENPEDGGDNNPSEGGDGNGGDEGDKGNPENPPEEKGTTYAWNFQAAGLASILSYDKSDGKLTLEAAGTYESTPAGLTMEFPVGAYFNKVDPAMTKSSNVTVDASTGAVEPGKKEGSDVLTVLSVKVKGPFTAEMICVANSSTDKTDRYAFIKIGDNEVCAPNKGTNTLSAKGEKLSYTYDGADEVTVSFGGTSFVRIHDIKITTENGDGTGKTAGEVKSTATFTPATDDSTANDEATLGLVGTTATSDALAVATADIVDGKVVITSVGAGSAVITVKGNAEEAVAKIEVSVSGTGKITLGIIEKYDNTPADLSLPLTLDASKFKEITTATSAIITPEGTDKQSKAVVTTLSLQLGKGMKIDSNRFNCTGKLAKGGEKGVIFTVPEGANEIEVTFYSGSADRQLLLAEYSDNNITTNAQTGQVKTIADEEKSETFVVTAGTKYMIGPLASGIYIKQIVFKTATSGDDAGNSDATD